MNIEVTDIATVRRQLHMHFLFRASIDPNAPSTSLNLPASSIKTIEVFIDEAIRLSTLLRSLVLDPDLSARLSDTDIVWDAETKECLQNYFFGSGTARAYKDFAKRKWNFVAGRYTRYWYHDGPGGVRLNVTRQVCGLTPGAPVYMPLRPENKEIRVLQIARGEPGEWIGDLVVIPLAEYPKYIAISYTWGDPEIVGRLKLQTGGGSIGLTKAVTRILENVLDGVARAWVWIDALCINQTDDEEKNSQVAMMGEIYSQAQQVVVSLDDPDDDSEVAMNMMHKATAAIWRAERDRRWPDLGEIIRSSGYKRADWVRMIEFFHRRWFSRIWIVQEVLLGPRPVVVCGKDAVPFEGLAEACARIMTHSQAFSALLVAQSSDMEALMNAQLLPTWTSFLRDTEPAMASVILSDWPRGLSNMRHLWNEFQRSKNGDGRQTLTSLLQVFGSEWEATNPRDKIYGLLSLAEGGSHDDLAPRYGDPIDDVYVRATTHLLKASSDLTILSKAGIGCPRALDSLPSWVPDWTLSPDIRTFSDLALRSRRHASRGRNSRIQFDPDNASKMTLDGILIDTIVQVTSVREKFSASDTQGYSRRLLDWVNEIEALVTSWPPSRSSQDNETRTRIRAERRTMLWKTLAPADPKPTYDNDPRTATEGGFDAWLQYHRAEASGSMTLSTKMHLVEDEEEGKFFEVACTYATTHRRAFLTQNGHLGLGYQNTCVGDEVAILLGGMVPFTLRKAEEPSEYRLVGEAYLHGFEDGGNADMGRVESIALV